MSDEWTEILCGKCGIRWRVQEAWRADKQENKADFYCPNGHCRVYRQSEADKLRGERDSLKQQMARVEDEKREAERRAELAEARERRLKKRAAAGTCPCCKRTFSNMNTHMRKKHPEFVADNVVKLKVG